jgi:hypothetical protein
MIRGEAAVRIGNFSFGRITVDGITYEHDVVIDHGKVRKRNKKPSKKFRESTRIRHCRWRKRFRGSAAGSSLAPAPTVIWRSWMR